MNLYPPPLYNNMVSKARMDWLMSQSITSTIPIPDGVEVPRGLSSTELMGLISEWQNNDESLKITTTPPSNEEYPISDTLRQIMVRELMSILACNGFNPELLSDDKLKVSKGRWSMDIENVLDKMPFPDYLPYQIKQSYKHYNAD